MGKTTLSENLYKIKTAIDDIKTVLEKPNLNIVDISANVITLKEEYNSALEDLESVEEPLEVNITPIGILDYSSYRIAVGSKPYSCYTLINNGDNDVEIEVSFYSPSGKCTTFCPPLVEAHTNDWGGDKIYDTNYGVPITRVDIKGKAINWVDSTGSITLNIDPVFTSNDFIYWTRTTIDNRINGRITATLIGDPTSTTLGAKMTLRYADSTVREFTYKLVNGQVNVVIDNVPLVMVGKVLKSVTIEPIEIEEYNLTVHYNKNKGNIITVVDMYDQSFNLIKKVNFNSNKDGYIHQTTYNLITPYIFIESSLDEAEPEFIRVNLPNPLDDIATTINFS